MTANDRFKQKFAARIWGGMILATGTHFAVLAFWPELQAQDWRYDPDEVEVVTLPPDIAIPDAPPPIQRPRTPIISSVEIDQNITMGVTTFEDNPPATLPPPPDSTPVRTGLSDTPFFTPFTVKPGIRNRDELLRALEKEYPPLLRDAGIGGTVNVWFAIDENGTLVRTQVHTGSGHRALDEAALRVAEIIEFTPALNRDRRVAVWISIPITFQVR